MNFTESFQEFSSKLSPTDLALYAGVGLVIWVLFKDRLSPVQQFLLGLLNKSKGLLAGGGLMKLPTVDVPKIDDVVVPSTSNNDVEDVFFKLVVSWKQTRDLAVQSGCTEAVKVADQMFPFLSPNVCSKKEDKLV
jgi:hypothetical protein